MGRFGKYVRHGLGALVGWGATWLAAETGIELTPEQKAAIVVGIYAATEKLLKRFGWLDPEGAADRAALKQAAARTL